jgi:PAS domain S-box-containing protein
MKRVIRPIPKDHEIVLDPYKTIMSKTDKKGIIEYANYYFMEISGYKEWELMGQPHNVIRHPDMPKLIFKVLWDRLNEAKPIKAVVKNLAKDGSYYWVIADFKTVTDNEGNIIAHYARRKAVPENVKEKISELYKSLMVLEKTGGMDASEVYFNGMLEDLHTDYDEFLLNTFNLSEEQLNSYMSSEISDEQMLGKNTDYQSAEDAIKKTTKKKGLFGKLSGK